MLLDRFRQYIGENELLRDSDRVLLAVSGGVDSMVMLSLFAQSGWPSAVAHCNFQLRGREGDEDTVLVEKEAARYGLRCHCRNFDTAGEMERTGESTQMAARRLRYGWFNELCAEHGYTAIAIAHQADDSVETFFINLFRGTGLRGLTGISVTNGRVVRPLLFATRKEITDYALANKIGYREDSSNRSTKYLRNKIRLGLVPRLREINPRFTDMMRRNVDRLTQAQTFIDAAVERIRAEVEKKNGSTTVIDTGRIDPAYPVNFVIYELLSSGYGFKGDVVDRIWDVLEKGYSGKRFYSRDYVAYTDRGRIIIEPIGDEDPCEVEFGEHTHRVYAGNSVYYLQWLDIDRLETLNVPENTALIDADLLTYPLTLRRWRDGDRFVPLGMEGSKKVSDYLIDAKVSLPEKQRQFVLVNSGNGRSEIMREHSNIFSFRHSAEDGVGLNADGGNGRSEIMREHSNNLSFRHSAEDGVGLNADGGADENRPGDIVWLVGRRADDRYKITPQTENVLKIIREVI